MFQLSCHNSSLLVPDTRMTFKRLTITLRGESLLFHSKRGCLQLCLPSILSHFLSQQHSHFPLREPPGLHSQSTGARASDMQCSHCNSLAIVIGWEIGSQCLLGQSETMSPWTSVGMAGKETFSSPWGCQEDGMEVWNNWGPSFLP